MQDVQQNTRVSKALRMMLPALLLLGLAGCQTPTKPLSNVEIQDGFHISDAGPLRPPEPQLKPTVNLATAPRRAEDSAALPFRPSESEIAWPTNWASGWIPLESWGRLNGLGKLVEVASNPHPKFEFHVPQGSIAVKVGSRIAQCNGLECWLGFAPQL